MTLNYVTGVVCSVSGKLHRDLFCSYTSPFALLRGVVMSNQSQQRTHLFIQLLQTLDSGTFIMPASLSPHGAEAHLMLPRRSSRAKNMRAHS